MTITVPALLTPSAGAPFERGTIERRELGEHDVLIDIAYAGICHSDIHQAREEWGASIFPMVPGHEIAGVISRRRVRRHEARRRRPRRRRVLRRLVPRVREVPGRRGAVLRARQRRHVQQPGATTAPPPTAATRRRSSSTRATCCASRTASRSTSPLRCCAPASRLYSPLQHWGAGPGTKVAIVGMGGLGHMGVQLAHALGAEVTVLSQRCPSRTTASRSAPTTTTRRATGRRSGDLRRSFDLIISTVGADIDVDAYLSLLRFEGSLVFVGLPENKQSFRVFSLTGGASEPVRVQHRRHPRDPGDARLLRAARHRRRSSRPSPPTTSTRPTTAWWAATSATASSSTRRRSLPEPPRGPIMHL